MRKKSIKINALLNLIKQVMQIVFPVITVPYITRVLLPDNYGKINFGNSIISYISLIAGLGISNYAIREGSLIREDREKLTSFSRQVFSINLCSTALSYCILAVLLLFVPYFYEYRLLLIIQGVAVLFTTLGADWINSIEEDYLYLTVRYVVLHVISLVLMFVLVKKPEDYYIYALITLVTSVGANLMNIFYIRRYVIISFTFRIDWKSHLLPILILFGNSIAMTIYVSSDVTMLGFFKGATEVGIYSVSTKIYSIIKQVLNAVLVVSIPRLCSYVGMNSFCDFRNLGKKILSALISLMFPLLAGIIVFRKDAVYLAGGANYLGASGSLLILSLATAFALIATFFSSCVLMPLRKERHILKGTIISALLNVVLNLFFIPQLGGLGAAITTLISEIFVAVYFWWLSRNEGYFFLDKRIICLSFFGSIIVGIISWMIKNAVNSFFVYFPISVTCSLMVYGAIQILGKNQIAMEFISRLRKRHVQ